jgi:hypothetical protein
MQLFQSIDKYVLEVGVNVRDVKEQLWQERDYNVLTSSWGTYTYAPTPRKCGWQVEVARVANGLAKRVQYTGFMRQMLVYTQPSVITDRLSRGSLSLIIRAQLCCSATGDRD